MKKLIWLFIIFLYTVFYKLYLIKFGELIIYIINPLIWLLFLIVVYKIIKKSNRRPNKIKDILISVIIINTLIYNIIYYAAGIVVGYTNNPYSTNINGIIINIFSILFISIIKELIRFRFINNKINRYYRTYLFIIFFLFCLMDINLFNINFTGDFLNIILINFVNPFSYNLFMTYTAFIIGYEANMIYLIINLLPPLVLSTITKYTSNIIILLNCIFYLVTYIIIQVLIDKDKKKIIIKKFNLTKAVPTIVILFLLISFNLGLFIIKPIVILSGSMYPLFKEGDLVIVKKCNSDELSVGDVMEYKKENYSVIHRIISISIKNGKKIIITKGDNNKDIDNPVYEEQVVGKMEFIIPYIGYPTYLIKNILKG